MKTKEFGLIFWIHLALIMCVLASPFWLSWKIILVCIALYYLQILIFKNCILTIIQFNTKDHNDSFYSHYLNRLGFRVNKHKLRIFLDYILPWLLFLIAITIQK